MKKILNEVWTVLKPDEKLEKLAEDLWLIQSKTGYRFSLDAVLLAGFVEPKPGEKVFDLGTGSGVIPLLLWRREKKLKILGLEIQKSLADLAIKNVAINNLDEVIQIIHGDLRKLKGEWLGKWDVLISNPPFFMEKEGNLSPNREKAMARHELACKLEDVVTAAKKLSKRRGRFLLIHRVERLAEILALFEEKGFSLSRLAFVHEHQEAEAKLVLVEGRADIKISPKVLPPILLKNDDGSDTDRMRRLFAGGNLYT